MPSALWLGLLACAAGDECNSLQLLQHRLDLAPSPVWPLKYLHVPKCGTSFLNAVVHLPGVCDVDAHFGLDKETLGRHFEKHFWRKCGQVCNASKFSCNPAATTHESIGSSYEAYKGHLVTMLRKPESRVLSAYFDPVWRHGAGTYNSVLEYAQGVRGLVTCQLTQDKAVDPLPKCTDLKEADAHEAARRLREGFVFVGLVEEWDLSICLFHKMLGGDCLFSEFENTRQNPNEYNTSELQGFNDTLDGIVYQEARSIFQRNLKLYGVSNESCQPCFQRAQLTADLEILRVRGFARPLPLDLAPFAVVLLSLLSA
ncbi:unnamed protein product [Effrenium voratum]|uniref:Uncharacterized protein n=1 Tax=Effrenium voratum TaxID=2562239 RepID=A0AA36ICP2_9DINO|nr:unnamed protein product [Effrenium voratum]